MFIQSLIEKSAEAKLGHVLVDYDVPLKKEVGKGSLKAVNWPKGFYVGGLRPPGRGTTRGSCCQHPQTLECRRIPNRSIQRDEVFRQRGGYPPP